VSAQRLVVVDSDSAVPGLLADVLKPGECRIDVLDDDAALTSLRQAPCDVLVAGPGRNGFDALKLLRLVRHLAPQTRVILTGNPDPARVIGAIRHRAYSYLRAPVAPGLFIDMVLQALGSPSWKDDIRLISARPEWVTLDVRCKMEAVERTTQFVREIEGDLPPAVREDVAAAFRELLMNAMEHGGHSDPKKRARTSLVRTAHSLIVHIHDPGQGFSLDFLPHAAISNPDGSPIHHVEVRAGEGKRPGGFGIMLARNMVDDLLYNERGNAVLFVKYLDRKPAARQ
jgi:anti-sigma regulatory factor (Ser/Thr protein kinase)/DNA-binding NarL/FixJ family response regulator